MIKSVSFVLLSFITQLALCQIDVNDPLRKSVFNDSLIEQYGIRSVTVFADMDEREIDGDATISGKIQEFEFDENGNVVYKLTARNGGNGPFIYYDKGSRPEFMAYDGNDELIYHSEEDYRTMSEIFHTADSAGNIVETEFVFKDRHQEARIIKQFEWKDGVRVGCNNITDDETIDTGIQTFDEEGRIMDSKNTYSRFTYEYTQSGDTLKTTETIYRGGELSSIQVYHRLSSLDDRYTYYSRTDHTGTEELIMTASYDEHGNAISYSLFDYSRSERGINVDEPTKLRIVNTYDYRGLLAKRSIYSEGSNNSDESLIEVNYYHYDGEELIYKVEKGSISRITLEKEELRDY